MVQYGRAITIRGNHEKKIVNWVVKERGDGFEGNISHGNDFTVNMVKGMLPARRAVWEQRLLALVDLSPDWIMLGRFLFVHGAAHRSIWGDTLFRVENESKRMAMALYGETTGKLAANGFPERLYNWVDDVPARHTAVVGHAVLSTDGPVTKTNDKGGKAIFLDTGSSKVIDGVQGYLSWMDLTLTKGNVIFDAFGRD
jgi:protein phosphatase